MWENNTIHQFSQQKISERELECNLSAKTAKEYCCQNEGKLEPKYKNKRTKSVENMLQKLMPLKCQEVLQRTF